MGQIQSYYRILGLEADASAEEIQEAIQNMRDLDTEGNYTAILNKMEKTLLPSSSRPQNTAPANGANAAPYNDFTQTAVWEEPEFTPPPQASLPAFEEDRAPSHGKTSRFLDFGDDTAHVGEHVIDRTPVKDHRSYITAEEIRAYNKPPSVFSKIFNFRNIVLLILAGAVGVAGFIFGMPLYQQYLSNKQSNEAMPALIRAKEDVENQMRRKPNTNSNALLTFPDTLTGNYDSPLYTVRASGNDESITLTFTQDAAEPLRGHALIMHTEHVPNIGLQWRCDISAGFPSTHKPAQCY